jgi:tyrosinase
MGPATSPNEPLFFLHHANVDRVWAKVGFSSIQFGVARLLTTLKWQGRNDTRLSDYTGFRVSQTTIPATITDTMPVMELAENGPVVKDYMDTLSGPLCYTYSKM